MNVMNILPISFFPTTTTLVDDDDNFLNALGTNLADITFCKKYTDPYEALNKLQQNIEGSHDQKIKRLWDTTDSEYSMSINISNIHQRIYDPNRFNENSVVIIDYAMPAMNGVEFCKQLNNLPIKKIMLTGEADYNLAVKAFNKGIIDKFILKSPHNQNNKVNVAVKEMQLRYFQDLSQFIFQSLKSESGICLDDSIFIDFFKETCNQHQIIEYYLLDDNGSFLLLDANAKSFVLLVKNESEMQTLAELAEEAPKHVLSALQQKTKIVSSFGNDIIPSEWEHHLHDATLLKGRENYYYAFLTNKHVFPLDDEKIASYNQYLSKII